MTFVPYGNADLDEEAQTVDCQHGDAECSANSYEQCSIAIYLDPDLYLPYISCLASFSNGVLEKKWPFQTCAENSSLDWQLISSCHDDSNISWQLQLESDSLTPDYHTYVPWVEVNGNIIDWFNGESLGKAICDEYPEDNKPEPCRCVNDSNAIVSFDCSVKR